jgi:hypothetical protein
METAPRPAPSRTFGQPYGLWTEAEMAPDRDRVTGVSGRRTAAATCRAWARPPRILYVDLPVFGPTRLVRDKRRWRCPSCR